MCCLRLLLVSRRRAFSDRVARPFRGNLELHFLRKLSIALHTSKGRIPFTKGRLLDGKLCAYRSYGVDVIFFSFFVVVAAAVMLRVVLPLRDFEGHVDGQRLIVTQSSD